MDFQPPPGQRARLALLLACLALASLGLIGARAGVLDAWIGRGQGSVGVIAGCDPGRQPALASARLPQMAQLRAGILDAFGSIGRRYEGGVIAPTNAWSDNSPRTLRSTRAAGGIWPEAYEIRWWMRNGVDFVADAFVFAGSQQAAGFFQLASGIGCHRDAVRKPASWPVGARNLIWLNPDDATEDDVYLLRGTRVYRLVAVAPTGRAHASSRAAPRINISALDFAACALPGAGCPIGGTGGSQSSA